MAAIPRLRAGVLCLGIALLAAWGCTGGQTGTPTSETCTLGTRARTDAAELAKWAGTYEGVLTLDPALHDTSGQSHPVQLVLLAQPDQIDPLSCKRGTAVAATLTLQSPPLELGLELRGLLTKTQLGAELVCDNGSDAEATLLLEHEGSATLALSWGTMTLTATGLTPNGH